MTLRLPAAAAFLLVLLSACSLRETPVDRGIRDQVLHRGIGPEPADLDPHFATATADYAVLSALFEGLVAEHPKDLSPVPGVADTWRMSSDGLVYTFHLRDTARWSNGDPVTSADFLESWKRALSPTLGSDYASLMYVVEGAEAYHKGQSADFSSVGVAAPDPRTVVIRLSLPTPAFLSMLQHWIWWPVHLPTLRAAGDPYVPGIRWARPGRLVGNGPFTLAEWKIGQRIVVRHNPRYWDADRVTLREIHFYPIEDANAEERVFRAGQLHVTDAMPPGRIDTYRAQSPSPLRIDPYLGTYFFRFNVAQPHLNNTKVRQALVMAVDRASIVNRVTRGGQLPSHAFTPHGLPGYEPPPGLPYDPVAARALLAEAGYPGGEGLPPLELLFNSSDHHRVVAETLQDMWRRELGVTARLVNMENKSVLAARRAGDYQILRSNWIGDYQDPTTFLNVFRSDSGNNYTGWSHPRYDGLLDAAARAPDGPPRAALLREAETLLLEEAPLLPLFTLTHVFLVHPSVEGWYPNLLDHHPYKHVRLRKP